MKKQIILVSALLVVGITGTAYASQSDHPTPPKKYFVCKYVGKPGVDEKLQTGNNPISVPDTTLTKPVVVGAYFTDGQNRSYVVAEDTDQPEPSCPAGDTPPVVDVCDNIQGVQATVPANHKLEGKNCIEQDAGDYTDGTGTTADSDKGEVKSTTSTPVETQETEVFFGK